MENTLEKALLAEINDFIARHRMSPTAFGREALRDGSFVSDIASGKRSPTLKTIERVRAYMRARDFREGAA